MNFRLDREREREICPEGKVSSSRSPSVDERAKEAIRINFSSPDCGPCPSRHLCTKTKRARRTLSVRPRAQHAALVAARARERTPEYKRLYRRLAGSKPHFAGARTNVAAACAIDRPP